MNTFSINTLGCKVNQYESCQIRQLLTDNGLAHVDKNDHADLVIVNTCCVTHIASAKSRQIIRKARKLNPNAAIVVAGCLPLGPANERLNSTDNVHFVARKADLPDVLQALIACDPPTPSNKPFFNAEIKDKTDHGKDSHSSSLPLLKAFSGQTRAFLKVQDGCDAFCTYCIIPKIRTHVCNKDVKSVLTEARSLVEAGHSEIVLTGIFLGAYGQNTARRRRWDPAHRDDLADLLDKVARIPGLRRVRLSSLEPADVTDRLLDVFCSRENIAPHLHLPLQSGSDRILKRMCRQYRLDDFRRSVDKLNARLDRPAITTDIIAAFPGETDDDFAATMALMRQTAFAKTHVFTFSPRSGTPASRMTPRVPANVARWRSRTLQELDIQLQNEFRRRFKGEEATVIIEALDPPRGRCERYFMVQLQHGDHAQLGQVVAATIT